MITDVKSPAEPPRAAREQKSPVGTEQSNKGSSRQQLISQFVVHSAITGAEKVGLFSSQKVWYLEEVCKQEQHDKLHSTIKKPLNTVSFKMLSFMNYILLQCKWKGVRKFYRNTDCRKNYLFLLL
jgi:hypothetical protein